MCAIFKSGKAMKSIASTRDIRENTIIRAYKKGYGYAKLRAVVVYDHFIITTAPEDLLPRISDGDSLDAYLWKENVASFEFPLRVIGKVREVPSFLVFAHTDEIRACAERQCLKAEVDIPIRFFLLRIERGEKSFYTEAVVFHEGRIVELGDREMMIRSPEELSLTALIKGHIPVGSGDIEFTGRLVSFSTNGGDFTYVVEFQGMNERDRLALLDQVFAEHKE